jgi:uncharacterized protein (DUF4415 family)
MTAKGRAIKSSLTKARAHVIQPHEYDEAPELTEDQILRAEVWRGDRLIRRGRPPLESPKQAVKLRLDADILERWRASGPGWQTRINAALRKAAPRRRTRS